MVSVQVGPRAPMLLHDSEYLELVEAINSHETMGYKGGMTYSGRVVIKELGRDDES